MARRRKEGGACGRWIQKSEAQLSFSFSSNGHFSPSFQDALHLSLYYSLPRTRTSSLPPARSQGSHPPILRSSHPLRLLPRLPRLPRTLLPHSLRRRHHQRHQAAVPSSMRPTGSFHRSLILVKVEERTRRGVDQSSPGSPLPFFPSSLLP